MPYYIEGKPVKTIKIKKKTMKICKDIKDKTKCLPPECKYVKTEKRQYCRNATRKTKHTPKKKIIKLSVKKPTIKIPDYIFEAISSFRKIGPLHLSELSRDIISKILELSNRTYRLGLEELITDKEYDIIWEYAKEHFPELPQVKNVGLDECTGRMQKLPYYMGSLDKIKDKESDFNSYKKKHTTDTEYIISDKLDGVSALLHCKVGETPKLFSRGNGTIGQDLSDFIGYVRGLNFDALEIDSDTNICKRDISVRGELIMRRDVFRLKYSDKFKTARYAVASNVIAKDRKDKLNILNDIIFIAYEQIYPKTQPENQMINLKQTYKFRVVNNQKLSFKELQKDNLANILRERRTKSTYDIDGIVITKNEEYKQPIKGNPKYSIAFKMLLDDQYAETTVTGVEWNISKNGYLIPKIHVNKIKLPSGSASKMSGFNARFIVNNKIGVGAKVYVKRSGDVLPTIHKVIEPAEEPSLPTEYDYEWDFRKVHFILKSISPNPRVQIKRILYFFHALGGYYLSLSTVTKLYDNGFYTIKDFLNMTQEQLLSRKIKGIAKKKAEKIVNTINNCMKKSNLIMIFDATGKIGSSFGAKRLYMISIQYPDAFDISIPRETRIDGLMSIKGFGAKSAEKFLNNIERVYQFIADNNIPIPDDIVSYFKHKNEHMDKYLVGVNVVFTELLNLDALENKILSEGGNIQNLPDSTTTDIVTGNIDATNEKMDLARELCLPVYTLQQFKDKYGLHDY
jgi:NAD-dependent DNA ligase